VVVLDHPGITVTMGAIDGLLQHGAPVISCGRNHLPQGLWMPFSSNHAVVHRLHEQIEAPRPRQKRIWQQVVQAKIRAQARNLPAGSPGRKKLEALIPTVRSGDPDNLEAHAARHYWRQLLPEAYESNFRRQPEAKDALNSFLNYGYAVLRALTARALVSAGFQPALGIFHRNRSNAFCLADDLMEPLRPLVDAVVVDLDRQIRTGKGEAGLTPENKRSLLALLAGNVRCAGEEGPLMVAVAGYVASFGRMLRGEAAVLSVPETPERE